MSIERSFPPCKRKKLSKKSWWMLSRYRVIQILRPVFSYPPYHWYAFQDFTSCFEEETGSSRFEHGTRPARPSQRIINSKSDIRTHFTLAVSSRSLALSRYICILHFVITSERRKEKREGEEEEDRRRIRKKKKRRRSVFFSPSVMNIFMNRRTFYITRWYTLLVRKRKNKRKRCNVETR